MIGTGEGAETTAYRYLNLALRLSQSRLPYMTRLMLVLPLHEPLGWTINTGSATLGPQFSSTRNSPFTQVGFRTNNNTWDVPNPTKVGDFLVDDLNHLE